MLKSKSKAILDKQIIQQQQQQQLNQNIPKQQQQTDQNKQKNKEIRNNNNIKDNDNISDRNQNNKNNIYSITPISLQPQYDKQKQYQKEQQDRILDVSNNKIKDVSTLKFSDSIQYLNLSDNQIKFITVNLPKNLQILNLQNNQLESLYLQNAKQNSQQQLFNNNSNNSSIKQQKNDKNCFLHSLPFLQQLFLAKNSIQSLTIDVFQCNKQLNYIDLSQNLLTNECLNVFHCLPSLQYLDLSSNYIATTHQDINKLKQNCKQLQILNIQSQNQSIQNQQPSDLSGQSSIKDEQKDPLRILEFNSAKSEYYQITKNNSLQFYQNNNNSQQLSQQTEDNSYFQNNNDSVINQNTFQAVSQYQQQKCSSFLSPPIDKLSQLKGSKSSQSSQQQQDKLSQNNGYTMSFAGNNTQNSGYNNTEIQDPFQKTIIDFKLDNPNKNMHNLSLICEKINKIIDGIEEQQERQKRDKQEKQQQIQQQQKYKIRLSSQRCRDEENSVYSEEQILFKDTVIQYKQQKNRNNLQGNCNKVVFDKTIDISNKEDVTQYVLRQLQKENGLVKDCKNLEELVSYISESRINTLQQEDQQLQQGQNGCSNNMLSNIQIEQKQLVHPKTINVIISPNNQSQQQNNEQLNASDKNNNQIVQSEILF